MTDYSSEDRERLGRAVARARRAKGYSDTTAWASALGRSTRVALGIERGESAGSKTYARIEEVLEWPRGACYEILDGTDLGVALRGSVGAPSQDDPSYVSGPGEKVEGGTSDDEVLRAIREMHEDIRTLSERVARLEQDGSP